MCGGLCPVPQKSKHALSLSASPGCSWPLALVTRGVHSHSGQKAKMEPQTKAGLDAQGQAQTGCGPDVGPVQNCQEDFAAISGSGVKHPPAV